MEKNTVQRVIAEYDAIFGKPDRETIDEIMESADDPAEQISNAFCYAAMYGFKIARQQLLKDCREMKIQFTRADMMPDTAWGMACKRGIAEQYYIVLNPNKPEDEITAAFLHECLHIYHDDYTSAEPVTEIERARQEELIRVLSLLVNEDRGKMGINPDLVEEFEDMKSGLL